MADIVGIGANVCDTLLEISSYPKEDTKLKADNIKICGGGPCATGLVAASKLGALCAFLGNMTDDNNGLFLKSDFESYGVSTKYASVLSGYETFSSCIWLSRDTASRTCVFSRGNIPSTSIGEAKEKAIAEAKILMVDGNDMGAAVTAAKIAKKNGTKVLYDAGGLYDGVENLLALSDIIIPSEEFSLAHTGGDCVEDAAKVLYEKYTPDVVVITQGKEGGIIYDGNEVKKYPAFLVDAVDTNGSGDVFHGAFAFCQTAGFDYYKSCVFSSAVSAIKCTKLGARQGVPTFNETVEFLKERGINV